MREGRAHTDAPRIPSHWHPTVLHGPTDSSTTQVAKAAPAQPVRVRPGGAGRAVRGVGPVHAGRRDLRPQPQRRQAEAGRLHRRRDEPRPLRRTAPERGNRCVASPALPSRLASPLLCPRPLLLGPTVAVSTWLLFLPSQTEGWAVIALSSARRCVCTVYSRALAAARDPG